MKNLYNSTNREPFGKSTFNLSGLPNRTSYSRDKMINVQKREKLRDLLITKFTKKFGLKTPEPLIVEEISRFLENEKLTDSDLKRLDERLKKLLLESSNLKNLKRGFSSDENNLNLNQSNNNLENGNNNDDHNFDYIQGYKSNVVLPELNNNYINDAVSVRSKVSRQSNKNSGVANLSKRAASERNNDARSVMTDFDDLESVTSRRNNNLERFDFEDQKDEWNAIVSYNRRLWEEEQRQNKLKDLEIKRRIREDLDNQIRQKLKRTYEENLKNQEYDEIQMQHNHYLEELERKRQQEIKDRIMREKENRDKQLKDEKIRKKIEYMKEKKFDKDIVKNIKNDIEKEKQNQLKKRLEEKEILQKTLKENELNRLRQIENLKQEKLDDIKATEEYGKIMDRQEQERVEYFKRIERNANNFVNKMSETVLSEVARKNKEEEERMRNYLDEKERRSVEIKFIFIFLS